MSTIALSGNDTFVLNDRVFKDFADGNFVELEYPNDIAAVKTGKNGNSIYSLNETGRQADVKLRLIRGSADDKYMQNLLNQQLANFAGTVLNVGELVKQVGDGLGNITADTYIISGGILLKQVPGKSNAEGDIEQSIVMYSMKFSNAPRVLT